MKRNLLALVALVLVSVVPASAQVTIPFSFSDGSVARADDVNSNFNTLGSAALNRTGGTISGNIAVSAAVTIDGIDIGATVCVACSPTFAAVTVTGTSTAALFSGSGASLTALNASNLSSGTVASARVAGTYSNAVTFSDAANVFVGNGSALTALNATNLATGTVADARLSANVGLFNAAVAFGYNATPLALRWTRSDAAALDVLWMSGVAGASDVFLDGPGALGTLTLRTNSTAAISLDASQNAVFSNTVRVATKLFAALGTPTNGTIVYCSNCDPASRPCTTGGASTGSLAFRQGGAWGCF